jgi:hypothetical protein
MSLPDFSTVVLASEGPALTQVGFGAVGIAAYVPSAATDGALTKVVTKKSDLTSAPASLASNHPAVIALERALQQSPTPDTIKILRLRTAPTISYRITPTNANSTVYSFTIELVGEEPVDISITSDSSATVDEICDAIATALIALTDAGEDLEGLLVTSVGGTGATGGTSTAIDLGMAQGGWFYLRDWNHARLAVKDNTPDPGVDADLSAIRDEDGDWYHLCTPYPSQAIGKEISDWSETQLVLFFLANSDTGAMSNVVTTDIQSVLADLSYKRTMCAFDKVGTDGMAGVAAACERAPWDPGAPPYAGGDFNAKTYVGVSDSHLSPNEKSVLRSKGYTVIESTAGRVHSLGGDAAGGVPMDQTRFTDWFGIRLQERIAKAQLDSQRIPFNAKGLAIYESLIRAQINAGITAGGINAVNADGEEPTIEMPSLAAIDPNEKAARNLTGIVVTFEYSSGIRTAEISVFVQL